MNKEYFKRGFFAMEKELMALLARGIVVAYPYWLEKDGLEEGPKVFFAKRASNLDTLALLAALGAKGFCA